METSPQHSSPAQRSPNARTPTDPLDRLRMLRAHPDRAKGLGDDLSIQMKTMKKISKSESAAGQAWATVVPDSIGDSTSIAGLRAGKLVVIVPSAAHRHVVDRWLSSGGLGELQTLARVPIRGVELKIDAQTPKLL